MKKEDSNISIKINGEEKSYSIKAIEQTKNPESDDFQWVIPSVNEKESKVVSIQGYKKEKRKKHIPSIFLASKKNHEDRTYSLTVISVIAAIIVGLVFGLGILKLMQESTIWNSKSKLVTNTTNQGAYTANIPERTFHLLQFGIYSEEERAKYALKGKAPFSFRIVSTKEGYRVFIGVFQNKKGQTAWGKLAEKNGYQYYRKEQVFDKKFLYVNSIEQKEVIEYFDKLFGELLKGTNASITKEQIEAIKKQNNIYQSYATVIGKEPILKEGMSLMKKAVDVIEKESDKPSFENKKNTQRVMLQLYANYNDLYNSKAFSEKNKQSSNKK